MRPLPSSDAPPAGRAVERDRDRGDVEPGRLGAVDVLHLGVQLAVGASWSSALKVRARRLQSSTSTTEFSTPPTNLV